MYYAEEKNGDIYQMTVFEMKGFHNKLQKERKEQGKKLLPPPPAEEELLI